MKKIIIVIALVFAFTLGTIFSADIATALKPATEVIVTNTDPIPALSFFVLNRSFRNKVKGIEKLSDKSHLVSKNTPKTPR